MTETTLRLPLLVKHRLVRSRNRLIRAWVGDCAFCEDDVIGRTHIDAMYLLERHIRLNHPRLHQFYTEEGTKA